MEEEIPKGKVMLSTGKIIDRADVAYGMIPYKNSKTLWTNASGQLYIKGLNGTLRKYPPKEKMTKKERIRLRREKEAR